ncbi:MAG: undecaprenyldiphospho-muramoylpentapeptide beta-N-acetylglucosaminyltransferase [bacterium]|nr:undecaprenyldiphospho-muramoylpentapeptide beta-N-acetylglucosaminyltransferase [bacterium]
MSVNFYKYKFVLTGGGTGGHIMPLIAMFDYLQEYPVEIIYIGESGGREEKIAEQNNIIFKGIAAGKLRRFNDIGSLLSNFLDIFRTIIGIIQSLNFLVQFRPNAILSKGGYVSLPVVIAGWVLKIPVLVHESDMEMGLTNKFSLKFTKFLATGFPIENYSKWEDLKMVFTGTPIDRDFFNLKATSSDYEFFGFNSRKPVLLVTGGLQGAHVINESIRKILPKLLENWQIIHLSGEGDYDIFIDIKANLDKYEDRYSVFPILGKDRIKAMRIASLVVSRASATTLAELSSMAKPVILIPLSSAASDHQNKNARVFESQGAATIISEKELTGDKLYETIRSLGENRGKLDAMGKAMETFSKPEAGKLLMEQLIQMIHE